MSLNQIQLIYTRASMLDMDRAATKEWAGYLLGKDVESLKDLTFIELAEVADNLKLTIKEQMKPMRNKILRMSDEMGWKLPNGKLDYQRIDNVIMNLGTTNPRKKKLYDLKKSELTAVHRQIRAMHSKSKVNA
ncbi:MAG: hypothetical protein AAFO91_02960 [Bacteroidota bacterium]